MKAKLIDIVSTLMHLKLFENEIIDKLELSVKITNNFNSSINSNPLPTISCKLINENFLEKIKSIFCFKKIIEIMSQNHIKTDKDINKAKIDELLKRNKNYISSFKSKNNDFISLQENPKELTEIEKVCVSKNNKKFCYPMRFNIITDILFDELLNVLNIKKENNLNKPEEIIVTFNNGKLAFRGLNDNFCRNDLSLFYLYSAIKNQESDSISYYPEAILDFKTKENLFNKFSSIMKEDILYNLINTPQYLKLNNKFEILLIFNKDQKNEDAHNLNSQYLDDNDPNKFSNKLLVFSFLFYSNYKNFYNSLKAYQKQNEKLFLINKKYIDEIKVFSQFYEIESILRRNIKLRSYLNKNELTNIKELKHFLDINFLKKFYYEKSDINKILSNIIFFNKSSKHLNNDESNNLF